ncbi:MAG: bifunctional NADH-specific enoyl-ACP reductase/trans-2-enoyl-CoA reductase, partial [Spirochaetaceae bacterium]
MTSHNQIGIFPDMIVHPKIKNNICLNAHPKGLEYLVDREIEYVKRQKRIDGPKNVLVIGASTGYGLASRIVAAFGSGAATVGVASGRHPTAVRTGNVGHYTMRAFDRAASSEGLYARSIFGDAFSDEIKDEVVEVLKSGNMKLDLVVYSLAASSRKIPGTGEIFRGSIRPIGRSYSSKSLDAGTEKIKMISFEPATEADIKGAVKVMGGEDWELWINRLQ